MGYLVIVDDKAKVESRMDMLKTDKQVKCVTNQIGYLIIHHYSKDELDMHYTEDDLVGSVFIETESALDALKQAIA